MDEEADRGRGKDIQGLGLRETRRTRFRGSAMSARAMYEAKKPAPTRTILRGLEVDGPLPLTLAMDLTWLRPVRVAKLVLIVVVIM